MLSFPAQSWQSSISAAKRSQNLTSLGYGRIASLIVPRVYLSDYFTATDDTQISQHGITHIITVMEDAPDITKSRVKPENRLHIRLADVPHADILSHLDETTKFIKEALAADSNNKVLVHCFQGVSRSATVVCAYLIAAMGKTALESIAFVQSRRGIVCPNTGFRRQLIKYSKAYAQDGDNQSSKPLEKLGGFASKLRQIALATPPAMGPEGKSIGKIKSPFLR